MKPGSSTALKERVSVEIKISSKSKKGPLLPASASKPIVVGKKVALPSSKKVVKPTKEKEEQSENEEGDKDEEEEKSEEEMEENEEKEEVSLQVRHGVNTKLIISLTMAKSRMRNPHCRQSTKRTRIPTRP